MGTGSFGGAGSGALGRAGSGAGGGRPEKDKRKRKKTGAKKGSTEGKRGAGSILLGWRTPDTPAPSFDDARELVRDTLATRNVAGFVFDVLTSAPVRKCYEELFNLSVLLGQQRDWTSVKEQYGVPDQPGCLSALADAVVARHGAEGTEIQRELASTAVLEVLVTAVGQDDDLFMEATADQVFDAIDRDVFRSLSGHYLGAVLGHELEREVPPLLQAERQVVRQAAQERADYLIRSFEGRYRGQEQFTHKRLLAIAADERAWVEDKLRKEIEP